MSPDQRGALDDGIQFAMAGNGRPDWGRMLQNAPNDEALKRIIRRMLKEGIEPPAQFLPPGYKPLLGIG